MIQDGKKVLGLIGIAKKAGKIVTGTEMTLEAVKSGNKKNSVRLLLCSADASENTIKKLKNAAEYYKVPLYTLGTDMEELARITGNRGGEISVVGILDEGFAVAIRGHIDNK